MTPKYLKNISDPYFPNTTKLSKKQFVGREVEINLIYKILDDYSKSSTFKNILITGEKSIGKSTLVNRIKQMFEDYNIITYYVELPRDESVSINEMEFFKDLIDELFDKYSPPDGSFFDQQQSEIWYSLTRDKYEHSSDYQDRKIHFATTYANYKKGIIEKLSYKTLEKDFECILNELLSKEMEIIGLSILIDEFQELSRNPLILDLLRQISDNLIGIVVVGSGLPTFYDRPVFEKFTRVSVPMNLKPMSKTEILDLIFKPLENVGYYSRFDVQRWFNSESVHEIVERSGGNPLHVNILCSNMFQYYQSDDSINELMLNRQVMDKVMEYYSQISEKSKKISLALQSSPKDQLEAFKMLYFYEGLTIRMAIILDLAFETITPEKERVSYEKIMNALLEIWDLGLFEFTDKNHTFETVKTMNINQLSQVEYKFIGDPIDKLYASYYYEDLTGNELPDNKNHSFEDMLASKYASKIQLSSIDNSIPVHVYHNKPLIQIEDVYNESKSIEDGVIQDLNDLVKISENEKDKKGSNETIQNISQKYSLDFPSHLSNMFEWEGYYIVITDLNIKGKRKYIYNMFPIYGGGNDIIKITKKVNDISIISKSFDQYMININMIYLYFLPKTALIKITILDIKNVTDELYNSVAKRDFEIAVRRASSIKVLMTRFRKEHMTVPINSINDYGFCLININNLPEAKSLLEDIKDKMLVSRINLAYILLKQNAITEAKAILSRTVRKKIGINEKLRFIHLAVSHPKITPENSIIEDCSLFNVASWNLALINAKEKNDPASYYSILKKMKLTENEKLIHERVLSWIYYYESKTSQSLKKARGLLKNCPDNNYFYNDVKNDIEIFESEHKVNCIQF